MMRKISFWCLAILFLSLWDYFEIGNKLTASLNKKILSLKHYRESCLDLGSTNN